jgi:signal transduction histidine kinase
MNYLSGIVSLLLLLILPAFAQAQTAFNIKEYTTENGLPSNGIKGLQWDETTGFLWIATEAGIVRFDGIYFKTFTKENTPFIASERISFVGKNNKGHIYFADLPKNIISVERNQLELVQQADKYSDNNTSFLIFVSERFHKSKRQTALPEIFSARYTNVVSLSDTSAFFKSADELYYYSLSMPAPVLCRKEVSSLFKLAGKICISTSAQQVFTIGSGNPGPSQIQYIPVAGNLTYLLTGTEIRYENGMKNPLVFKDGNAWMLELSGETITAHLLISGIPRDIFIKSAQYIAELNILFIGTDSKGIMVFYPDRVTSMKNALGGKRNRNAYYSQVELSNGNVLTNEGDILGNANNAVKLPIEGKFGVSLYTMNDSVIWYHKYSAPNEYSNLHSYNYHSGKTISYPKIRYADAMISVRDTLFVVSEKGFGYLDGDSLRIVVALGGKRGSIYSSSVELSPGVFAIASCDALFKINTRTGRLDTLLAKENSCIRSLWKYHDYLFIGTYGAGYFIYRNGSMKQMPLDKSSYLLYTHCFIPDDKGFCFLSTNRGLFKASIQQMTRAFEKEDIPVYYYYFGRNDGMQTTELNGGCTPCALALKNKVISFPTMDGLLWVDPRKAIPVLPRGDIFFDEVMVDGKKYTSDSILLQSLSHDVSSIRVSIALSAWCNKENIYLDYQLNNSGKWIPVNLDNGLNIEFNNLPPGRYTIMIRKLNGFDNDNYVFQSISFYINVPWYKRAWFAAMVLLAIAGLLYWFFRFRTRQYKIRQIKLEKQVAEKTKALQSQNEILEKNNTIKTRLISIISHDIITPLKFVTVAGKELLEKKEKMPESLQQETIQEITNTSQELQLLSTNILNWIKYQNENRMVAKEYFYVAEVVREALGILNTLAKQKGLRLVNDVDPSLQVSQYYEPLKILVYNLLANAIHFTQEGTIRVSSTETAGLVVLAVKDAGCGMSEEQINNILADQTIISSANANNKKGHGLGYLIIKDLIKMMGAQLEITSEEQKGTTARIIIRR